MSPEHAPTSLPVPAPAPGAGPAPVFNLPASLGDGFRGRDEFLAVLRAQLARRPAVIHGIGGLGKTRAAVEYGHRYRADYSAVLLIRADTPDNFNRNLADLSGPTLLNLPEAASRDQEERRQAVIRRLAQQLQNQNQSQKPGWLLIIDNVDSVEMALLVEELLPHWQSGHVIITSRIRDWGDEVKVIDLDILTEAAAVEILTERTLGWRATLPTDAADLQALAAQLEGLPLAVEQAAAYIRTQGITIAQYLQRWQEERRTLLEWFKPQRAGKGYPMSVAVTWVTTFNHLSAPARMLLELLSFLASAPIPCGLLETDEAAEILSADQATSSSLASSGPGSASAAIIGQARGELNRYSLIRYLETPPNTLSVHRLVQEIVRLRLDDASRNERREQAAWIMDASVPSDREDPRTWPRWIELAPHLEKILEDAETKGDPAPVPYLLNCYGSFLQFRTGSYSAAEPLLRRALKARERVLGREHSDTLNSVNNLGLLLKDKGDLVHAEALYLRALEACERVLGPEHPDTLTSVSNLAGLLLEKGDLVQAESLFRRVLEARERLLGPENRNILASANNLASLLQNKGDLEQAEKLYLRVQRGCERLLGPEHPHTLSSISNLATLYIVKGDLAKAETLCRKALEASTRVLGPKHPDTLNRLSGLAILLQDMGDLEEAEPLHRRAIEGMEQVLGSEHPTTLNGLHNFAYFLQGKGDLAEAEPLYRRVLEARERVLGQEHPDTLNCVNNLAHVLQDKGDLVQAEPLYRRALEARERVLGQEHPDTLTSVNNLAYLLHDKGDLAQAEPLYRRALARSERVLGKENPRTQKTARNLEGLLQAKQREATSSDSSSTSPSMRSSPSHPTATPTPPFHVFLCHNSKDKDEVRKLNAGLKARSLRTWFDEEQLVPGRPWQDELEEQIDSIGAAIVCISDAGQGPWQQMELRGFIQEFVRRKVPVIPVILPTCQATTPALPVFLRAFHYVDMRRHSPDPYAQMKWGITGERPPDVDNATTAPPPPSSRHQTQPPDPRQPQGQNLSQPSSPQTVQTPPHSTTNTSPPPMSATPRSFQSTGPIHFEIREAVVQAFDESDIDDLLLKHFNIKRSHIVAHKPFGPMVQDVQMYFDRRGELPYFVAACAQERPSEPGIQAVYAAHSRDYIDAVTRAKAGAALATGKLPPAARPQAQGQPQAHQPQPMAQPQPPSGYAYLAGLSSDDLRDLLSTRLSRSEVNDLWFTLMEYPMDRDLRSHSLPECVMELLARARQQKKMDALLNRLCRLPGRDDLTRP